MENYLIPPEICLIVRAFSRTRSLREAAKQLGCDPASLVRKAQRIEEDYQLLQKVRGRWALTATGLQAVQWVEQSLVAQRAMIGSSRRFRVAATMWLAEQILIPAANRLMAEFGPDVSLFLQTAGPDFESALLNASVDCVIACHPPQDPAIAHRRIADERWVAIAPASWSRRVDALQGDQLVGFLKNQPFIRHSGINPSDATGLPFRLTESEVSVDSLICVRGAVSSGLGWSCVPEMAVRSLLADGKVVELAFPIRLTGKLCVWWLRSRRDAKAGAQVLADWLGQSFGAARGPRASKPASAASASRTS